MPWYAIRTVYHFGVKSGVKNIFEERVACFSAETVEEAHMLAKAEANEYSRNNEFIAHEDQVGYLLDPVNLSQGQEVWSELFEANESLEQFYENRYMKYTYLPE
jgi:hypothetical protein